MSVNGTAIHVGQTWRTISGQVLEVMGRNSWPPEYPWSLATPDGRRRYCFNDYGVSQVDVNNQLHELLSWTDATGNVDNTTKATNPKDAIGDRKVPLWLCSAIAMAHWAAAQFAGLIKYGAWNWRAAGVRTSTYLSAIARHWTRYANGERCDPIDGTHHLGNIMACCAILLEAEAIGKLNDDRSPKAELQPVFDEVEAMMVRLKELYADKTPKHWTINDEIPHD